MAETKQKVKDGGPAYPSGLDSSTETAWPVNEGMTLRDYFAGQALAGLIASKLHSLAFATQDDAAYCYGVADAMLAAREERQS
jgi:hypothetical protein